MSPLLRSSVNLIGLALLAVFAPSTAFAQEIDPRLDSLRPLINKEWRGVMKSPDGKNEFQVIQKFDLLEKGKIIRFTRTVQELGSRSEGFIYWDDMAKTLSFFFLDTSGVIQSGTVKVENRVFTFEGKMSWPTPPPDSRVKQSYEIKNTFEFVSETELVDKWFQNAFGPWRPGHVITFRVAA